MEFSYEAISKVLAGIRDFIIRFVDEMKAFVAGMKKGAAFNKLPEDVDDSELTEVEE